MAPSATSTSEGITNHSTMLFTKSSAVLHHHVLLRRVYHRLQRSSLFESHLHLINMRFPASSTSSLVLSSSVLMALRYLFSSLAAFLPTNFTSSVDHARDKEVLVSKITSAFPRKLPLPSIQALTHRKLDKSLGFLSFLTTSIETSLPRLLSSKYTFDITSLPIWSVSFCCDFRRKESGGNLTCQPRADFNGQAWLV